MTPRDEIISEMLRRRVSAIIRTNDRRLADDAMAAAVIGGFRMIEFTLTTPGALELIAKYAANRELLVGAGTVLTPQDAIAAVNAGARFIVSPVFDPDVIEEAHALGAVSMPGVFTPTEMFIAHRAGADFLKLFPAPHDVPAHIRSIRGPLPALRIYPTNGVTVENVEAVLAAGAAGAGFVNALFDPADLCARNFTAIESRAAQLILAADRAPRLW